MTTTIVRFLFNVFRNQSTGGSALVKSMILYFSILAVRVLDCLPTFSAFHFFHKAAAKDQ